MKNTDFAQQLSNTGNSATVIKHYDVFQTKLSILNKQNSICPLCGQAIIVATDAVLDHDHATGIIRGTLHDYCNRSLGFIENMLAHSTIEDVTDRLTRYINYHKQHPLDIIHPRHARVIREKRKKVVKHARLKLTEEEKIRYKAALAEGALAHPNPKRNTSREGSWARTAKKFNLSYDRLLAYVNNSRPLSELD